MNKPFIIGIAYYMTARPCHYKKLAGVINYIYKGNLGVRFIIKKR